MLRPKSFNDWRRSLNMSPSLKILRVAGGGIVYWSRRWPVATSYESTVRLRSGQFISNCPRLTAVGIACGCADKKLSLACTTSQCKQSNECEETQFFRSLAYSVLRKCAGFTSLEKLRPVNVAEEFD